MALTDPIADLLSCLKNALKEKKESVEVPHSSLKEAVVKILVDEGFVGGFESLQKGSKKSLRITLKYDAKKVPVISNLVRVSRPGRRQYIRSTQIPKVLGGFGLSILSTSKGILSCAQARRQKLGGELLLKVW